MNSHEEIQQIEGEGRKIARRLSRLEELAGSLGKRPEFEPLLHELQPLLHSHFEREDASDGLHASIADDAVNLLPQVEGLAAEHCEIESELEALTEKSARFAGLAAELEVGIRSLIEHLRAHEAEENRIAVHAVYDVEGGG